MSRSVPPSLLMILHKGKSVCVRKLFVINLDWSCVGSIQCHNFSLLAADVQANLLCKGVEAMRLLLYVGVGV